ncbi:MAG: DUF4783 domain-containing protein [Chitinophagaceae bacterium]|jgi:hypothetical protein|nr:DUF4783 domain-containing protein [Chitinophagaceae bacterium]OQY95749.1 MAG: hypothetical protein B6D37_04650 [Sphingobacteriales bacterium UTBCD1]
MKQLFTFLLIAPLVVLTAFTQKNDIDGVIGALRSGNAEELSRYFDDNVELTLPDKSDNYSRAQAVLILRDFFSNNSVSNFELKHKGDNGGGQFCIGTLQTKTGNFRTTVFMKLKGSRQVVKQIRFQAIE